MATNNMPKVKPDLSIKEIADLYIRKNFQNLYEYFSQQNQLLDFQFFEVVFEKAEAKRKIAHGLGKIPRDIVRCSIVGTGLVQFYKGEFDAQNLIITATGPCKIRFFAGTYWRDRPTNNFALADYEEWGVTVSETSSKILQSEREYGPTGKNEFIFVKNPSDVFPVNIKLPDAKLFTSSRFTIKKVGSSTQAIVVLPDTSLGQTVDGGTAYYIYEQNAAITFVSDGTQWYVISHYAPTSVPVGIVVAAPYTGIPYGWLLCDGSAVSRTRYASLFSVIGTYYGGGDDSTTFNLPDYRGQFLRGMMQITTIVGSGTASGNAALFVTHGIKRTGMRVFLSSGTLTGLATQTLYYAIVVDENTLAFATSRNNAFANTRIAISGANSAVIGQYEDTDVATRSACSENGLSGAAIGSYQEDAMQGHIHSTDFFSGGIAAQNFNGGTDGPTLRGSRNSSNPATDSSNFTPRTTKETRPVNIYVNFLIRAY